MCWKCCGRRSALKDKPVRRVVFNAITKQAVLDAMANPRDIDMPLVDAYLARRALDYLFGFTLSPVLWRKLPGARSAGRVQSVALRLRLRPRSGDRTLRPRGILEYRRHPWKRRAIDRFEARLTASMARSSASWISRISNRRTTSRRCWKARLQGALRSRQSRPSATPARPSPRRLCSRRLFAGSAFPPSAPCRSRRSSMKGWTSAARPRV